MVGLEPQRSRALTDLSNDKKEKDVGMKNANLTVAELAKHKFLPLSRNSV